MLECTEAPERKAAITKTQRLTIDSFIEAGAAHGCLEAGKMTGLHLDDWQPAFLSRHTADTDESKKRAFRRVRADLVASGALTVRDDLYSPRNDDISEAIQAKRTGRTSSGFVRGQKRKG